MMKKYFTINKQSIFLILAILIATIAFGQSTRTDKRILKDSKKAKNTFIKTDPSIKKWFDNAYGYVIFPNVGKAGLGIGGAFGKGIVYINNTAIGRAHLSQVSVGFQAGAQEPGHLPAWSGDHPGRWRQRGPAPEPFADPGGRAGRQGEVGERHHGHRVERALAAGGADARAAPRPHDAAGHCGHWPGSAPEVTHSDGQHALRDGLTTVVVGSSRVGCRAVGLGRQHDVLQRCATRPAQRG